MPGRHLDDSLAHGPRERAGHGRPGQVPVPRKACGPLPAHGRPRIGHCPKKDSVGAQLAESAHLAIPHKSSLHHIHGYVRGRPTSTTSRRTHGMTCVGLHLLARVGLPLRQSIYYEMICGPHPSSLPPLSSLRRRADTNQLQSLYWRCKSVGRWLRRCWRRPDTC